MKETTCSQIAGILNEFIDVQIKARIPSINITEELRKQPFHAELFPTILPRMAYYSMISSKMRRDIGSVFEEIAFLILKDRLGENNVRKQHVLVGELNVQCKNAIEQIVNDLFNQGSTHRKPNLPEELDLVTASLNEKSGVEKIGIRVDIKAENFENTSPLYLEMKSYTNALNKNAASAVKRDFLLIHSLDLKRTPKVVVGFAYGTMKSFTSHFPNKCFFDPKHECLVGEELWDTLGGGATYETLLEVFTEVGQKRKEDLDRVIDACLKQQKKFNQLTIV